MDNKCFIAGLPNAGKTTFLAALMNLISADNYDSKLKLHRIENVQYLANLSEKWVNMEPLERTFQTNEHKDITINLELPNKETVDLYLPDLSGETFQKIYAVHEIPEELANYIIEADTFLFFVNVKNVKELGLISEHFRDQNNEESINTKPLTRDPKEHDPLQIQIIQLLRIFLHLRKNKKIKIGFMFSAWDLMKSNCSEMKPEQFLNERMNMLSQYCNSNPQYIEYYTWGISAQGGELEQKDSLLDKEYPYQRILVESNDDYIGNDLTLPLYLLIGD
jgi:hypothetical protein